MTLDASQDESWLDALRAGFDWVSMVVYRYEAAQRVKPAAGANRRVTVQDIEKARTLRRAGMSYRAIAAEMAWCYTTAFRYVKGTQKARGAGTPDPPLPAKEH